MELDSIWVRVVCTCTKQRIALGVLVEKPKTTRVIWGKVNSEWFMQTVAWFEPNAKAVFLLRQLVTEFM